MQQRLSVGQQLHARVAGAGRSRTRTSRLCTCNCRLPGVEGCYVATGHSCWGILNGPATGEAMAELIVRGSSSSVDLSAFDPARFVSRGSMARARR